MHAEDKGRHRRHRAHEEQGRQVESRFGCVSREAIREEKREGREAMSRKARTARNRAAKKQ